MPIASTYAGNPQLAAARVGSTAAGFAPHPASVARSSGSMVSSSSGVGGGLAPPMLPAQRAAMAASQGYIQPGARAPVARGAPPRALAEDNAALPAGAARSVHSQGPDANIGVPKQLDNFGRYDRSWSIQDALDQHANLADQREVLAETAHSRHKVRNTQLKFAELEVSEALQQAQTIHPAVAGDTDAVLQRASNLRSMVRNLRLAIQLRNMEQEQLEQQIKSADVEIEKSRKEMTSMKEVIDDKSLVMAVDDSQPAQPIPKDDNGEPLQQKYFYCTNCKVGGHGQRFCDYFLERPNWRVYPHQKWFEDEKGNEYHCPLGKKLVNFADESHFSKIAMYLKGRAWLEEKTKVLELAGKLIPETFIIEKGVWRDGKAPPADSEVSNLPWFVKEADRNWGTSVHVCSKPSECMSLVKPDSTYVVQQHIKDPLLMSDGRKCHIKFYVLMLGLEDGVRWHLYTFKDGYLSISPNAWSPTDISKETQVTIIRSERINDWDAWEDAYPKCKEAVGRVMKTAVESGKLEGRLGKKQFEILSADFIVDTNKDVWLFEFNMSPVLKDPQDAPKVNDADMIRGALHIVSPIEGGSPDQWDFVGEYIGQPPPKVVPKASAAPPADSSADASAVPAPDGGATQAAAADA